MKIMKLLNGINWKYLIILDACRYDTFAKVYKEYIDEDRIITFKKIKTYARDTREWLNKNFNDGVYPNIIYISTNPFINSKGIIPKRGFDATKHFFKIIDVWETGWRNGTVPPDEVTKTAIATSHIYPNKKLIIHYVQPHEPYIWEENYSQEKVFGGFGKSDLKTKVITSLLNHLFPHETLWRILKKTKIQPTWNTAKIWMEGGREAVIEAYENNLRRALSSLSNLINIKGIKIITADHAELLGEGGYYGHNPKYPKRLQKIVYEVPLVVVR